MRYPWRLLYFTIVMLINIFFLWEGCTKSKLPTYFFFQFQENREIWLCNVLQTMVWLRKSNGWRESGNLPNYFHLFLSSSVQNRQFQPFFFRISFRILKLKRNLGGGGRGPNISFFAQCSLPFRQPLPTYCSWSKTINWRPEESSRRISLVDNADSSSGWPHLEDGLLLLFLYLQNDVEVQGKRNWSSQVKSGCPKKPFVSKKLIVDVIIYVQQKGGDLKKTVIYRHVHLIRPILCYHLSNRCGQRIKLSAELSKLKLE